MLNVLQHEESRVVSIKHHLQVLLVTCYQVWRLFSRTMFTQQSSSSPSDQTVLPSNNKNQILLLLMNTSLTVSLLTSLKSYFLWLMVICAGLVPLRTSGAVDHACNKRTWKNWVRLQCRLKDSITSAHHPSWRKNEFWLAWCVGGYVCRCTVMNVNAEPSFLMASKSQVQCSFKACLLFQ